MTDTCSFRTAVGGFHKGDVTDYISKTALAHEAKLAELENKLEALQAENDRLRQQLLEQSLSAQPEISEEPQEDVDSLLERELAAYRRAEATERWATQRVRKLYEDMQAVCDRTVGQFAAAGNALREAMEIMDKQMEVIHVSENDLHESLRASAQELQAMSQLVMDPAEGLED